MIRVVVSILAGALLAGCAAIGGTPADPTRERLELTAAIEFWGIAKGIVQVAEISYPGLASIVTPTLAITDPIVALAQTKLDALDTPADELVSYAAQIRTAGVRVENEAAPLVTVKPNT